MIYVNLFGRIGNNLFQIATAASLAHKNKMNFFIYPIDYWCDEPDNCLLRDYLKQYENNILRKAIIADQIPNRYDQINEHEIGKQQDIILSKKTNDILLNGYFQSEKYFVESVVRALFKIDNNSYNYIREKYGEILFSGNSITSIQVRRGDYLKVPEYHAICSMGYYNAAVKFIGKSQKYFIVSDDMDWCKKQFTGSNYFFSDDESPAIDLYIQSLCTNNIISNSSFAWWGAWLNSNPEKIVVTPKKWYGWKHQHISTDDLIPESWHRIENPLEMRYRILAAKNIVTSYLANILIKIKGAIIP